MADFEKVIPSILVHEGGFVDDPDDPGGITNFGITLSWLRQFEPDATADTIRSMNVDQARTRYRDYIWTKRGYDRFASDAAAEKVMDMAVNFGEEYGHQLAQKAANVLGCGLAVDGDLGPMSFAAFNGLDQRAFVEKMKELASDRYNRIVLRRPKSMKYLKGWLRRAACTTYSRCRDCLAKGLKNEAV